MARAVDVFTLVPTAAPPTSPSARHALPASLSSTPPASLAQTSVKPAAQESAPPVFQVILQILMESVFLPVRSHAPPALTTSHLSAFLATVEHISTDPLASSTPLATPTFPAPTADRDSATISSARSACSAP